MQLIICQTPLHLLLAYIISNKKPLDTIFVWIDESKIDEIFFEKIAKIISNKIIRLPGANDLPQQKKRTLQRLANIRLLKSLENLEKIRELLVFHDSTPEVQFLINKIALNKGYISLGEDGVALYEVGGFLNVRRWSSIIGKLIYGLWWHPNNRIGVHPKINKVHATFPENIRGDLVFENVDEIPPWNCSDNEFFGDLIKEIQPDLKGGILYIAPFLSQIPAEKVTGHINFLLLQGKAVFIKFHPREKNILINQVMMGVDKNLVKLLSVGLPAEIFCIGVRAPDHVVGCRSSSLHIIKKLFPEIKVSFFEDELYDYFDSGWRSFFQKINVSEIKLNNNNG